jgi:hypothetical protein
MLILNMIFNLYKSYNKNIIFIIYFFKKFILNIYFIKKLILNINHINETETIILYLLSSDL